VLYSSSKPPHVTRRQHSFPPRRSSDLFVFPAANPATDSDALHYSRHEFTTYFLQHMERQPHAVDSTDGNWHLDGSRHVDHNHLRSEEHTSELQSRVDLVCRLLLEKKKK